MTKEQETRLAEIELCMKRYFDANIKPMMVGLQRELNHNKADERAAYIAGPVGKLQSVTTNDPFATAWGQQQALRNTGQWNSKTTEDYVAMCRENLEKGDYASDLSTLSQIWRKAVIDTIGRDAYDAKSKELGADLADMYVSYRMEGMMINHLAEQRVPKDSMDYILGKAFNESLVGTLFGLQHTPMDHQLGEKAEAMYAPTLIEKGTGLALAFGIDAATTYGFSSWATLGKLAKTEVLIRSAEGVYSYFTEGNERSVEEHISKGVFDQNKDFLTNVQRHAGQMKAEECAFAYQVSEQLHKPLSLMTEEDRAKKIPFYPKKPDYSMGMGTQSQESPSVQIPYAPGYDPSHPLETQNVETRTEMEHQENTSTIETAPAGARVLEEEVARPPEQQVGGWGNMLSGLGLSGLGDVGRNMGYVMSMLPDLMVGLFTGKTKSLGLKDNMIPLASIMVGLFVRNPLLKTVLIGMGGMNLFNKAGHEALEGRSTTEGLAQNNVPRYKIYEDEPLNSRLQNPELKGNILFANVDGVPCSIQLPEHTIAAYEAGALPLNRLANAVLAKSDEMSRLAQQNYEESESRGISHSRGI